MLLGCSSDDGKPTGGGSGTGTGTGTGTGGGSETATETGAATPAPTETQEAGAAGAKKAAIEACMKDDDCASGVCYLGDQGSYCSLKCTADTAATVCIAPFAGTCNKKGFCKKP
jgi:hypothetical protein